MNVWQYGALSAAVLAAVVGNAYVQRQQFYLACVYLTKSNANMLVLYNTAFFSIFMFSKLVRKIFFGQLRAIEVEVWLLAQQALGGRQRAHGLPPCIAAPVRRGLVLVYGDAACAVDVPQRV
jgi:hypothetical protein